MRLKKSISVFAVAVFLAAVASAQTLPQGVQKVTSIEGVTEYAYPNGLHVLLFPDNSKPKVTVNVVYQVGSRNEGYGETGMAHLLEHMVFKTSKSGREIFRELTDKTGGNFNGTTSYDQTMYFETFNASDENLRWALGLETDRMVNMTMLKKDLDTEMTVVRNEMESGENSPMNVLHTRVMAAAYNFHNYGKTVIGNRTDVEKVPIANLAAFYQKYYQPDNADLIIAGQFDEAKALAMVAETLGSVPKPERVLTQPYTAEPTQEGERSVMLRRVGNIQGIMVVYHIPAALHPDMAALDVMAQVLGAPQTGRLYKALVDNKKAVAASMSAGGMHDPGVALVFAQLKPDQSIDEAQQILLKTVEGLAAEPPTQEEVERAKSRILKNIELALTNTQTMGMMLGGYVGDGDWREFYLSRDEISKVTPADVTRVAKAYLKPSNRTLGEFIPTSAPDRAEIPPTPDTAARFKDYKGGGTIQQGEAFDPTPKNIEARVIRAKLPNGLKLVMFPKKTRGGTVVASMIVRFGDEKSLFGKSTTGTMAGGLLMRGTRNKNRQQIQDETDRLKAQINVSGGVNSANANIRTLEANLADSLRFARELLREPSFPEAEFEQIRQQRIAGAESAKTEPTSLASLEMSRHMSAQYKRGDVRYVPTIDEQIEDLKKVTLDDVRKMYAQFYGAGEGEIVISGQFDPAQIQKLVTELFGDWKSASPYERILNPYAKVEAINRKIETPDKQNALFMFGMPLKMSDEDPDEPALNIAGMVFGGTPNSRLFQRIRVKDGLSYGANAGFSIPTKDDGGRLFGSAIAAPQNMPKVEADFNDELAKALKDGFTADEVEKAKKTWLEERAVARAEEASIANLLMTRERWGRTLDWDARMETAVAALTPSQVNDAFKRHVDPAAISIVKGGDFKKAGAYQ
ncbi:MAG: pitrilysin family protein [Candidatus Sulfopaludibacter sp.]|nr:pitrilysin family protein [Candidatus Sulfopaludibacter sp.]